MVRIKERGLSPGSSKGFTLIELLVVIAIIGILSAVVLASLSSSRGRARIAAAQQTMHSIQAGAVTCMTNVSGGGVAITLPDESNYGGSSGTLKDICTNGAKYQRLPGGWTYCDGTATGTCGDEASSSNINGFRIIAESSTDKVIILCQESGCITQNEFPVNSTWD